MKNRFLISVIIFLGSINSTLVPIFYGTVILRNPITQKTVILLYDYHKGDHDENYDTVIKQQEEVINLVTNLMHMNESVKLIIEDPVSTLIEKNAKKMFKNLMKQDEFSDKLYKKKLKQLDDKLSPLALLHILCLKHDIPSVNIDFRDLSEEEKITAIADINNTVLDRFANYYKDYSSEFITEHQPHYIDALIFNTIETSTESIFIVCCGGVHAAVIAKELYNDQGYTHVIVKESDFLTYFYKNLLYSFERDIPLPIFFDTSEIIEPLHNLDSIIIEEISQSL